MRGGSCERFGVPHSIETPFSPRQGLVSKRRIFARQPGPPEPAQDGRGRPDHGALPREARLHLDERDVRSALVAAAPRDEPCGDNCKNPRYRTPAASSSRQCHLIVDTSLLRLRVWDAVLHDVPWKGFSLSIGEKRE